MYNPMILYMTCVFSNTTHVCQMISRIFMIVLREKRSSHCKMKRYFHSHGRYRIILGVDTFHKFWVLFVNYWELYQLFGGIENKSSWQKRLDWIFYAFGGFSTTVKQKLREALLLMMIPNPWNMIVLINTEATHSTRCQRMYRTSRLVYTT